MIIDSQHKPHSHSYISEPLKQLDGAIDSSDEDGPESSDTDGEDDDPDKEDEDDENVPDSPYVHEEPLNSGDDLTEEETADLFDTDNVIVCQYDKVCNFKTKYETHISAHIVLSF